MAPAGDSVGLPHGTPHHTPVCETSRARGHMHSTGACSAAPCEPATSGKRARGCLGVLAHTVCVRRQAGRAGRAASPRCMAGARGKARTHVRRHGAVCASAATEWAATKCQRIPGAVHDPSGDTVPPTTGPRPPLPRRARRLTAPLLAGATQTMALEVCMWLTAIKWLAPWLSPRADSSGPAERKA